MSLISIHLCIIPNKGTTKTLDKVYFGGLGVEPRRSSTQMKRPTVRLPSVYTTYILLYKKVVVVNVCNQCGIVKSCNTLVSLSSLLNGAYTCDLSRTWSTSRCCLASKEQLRPYMLSGLILNARSYSAVQSMNYSRYTRGAHLMVLSY